MTTFDDRKNAFENKFKHDEELKFKANARRNKLVGLWAAGKLGKEGAEAETYAQQVVAADFDRPGDEDVLEKLLADLNAAGLGLSAGDVRFEMDRLMEEAVSQIKAG